MSTLLSINCFAVRRVNAFFPSRAAGVLHRDKLKHRRFFASTATSHPAFNNFTESNGDIVAAGGVSGAESYPLFETTSPRSLVNGSNRPKHKTGVIPPDEDTTTLPRHSTNAKAWLRQEVARFDPTTPIEEAETPPSTWYTSRDMLELERDAIFLGGWVAVGAMIGDDPGAYQTGTFAGQPYLLTRNKEGELQAFYNICSHAGSCLVGPWTEATGRGSCPKLSKDLVGQDGRGNLLSASSSPNLRRRPAFQCPYHGWQFNLDGQLIKATNLNGIRDFSPKRYGLKPIPVQQMGSVVFLNFGSPSSSTTSNNDSFVHNRDLLSERLEQSGFAGDFGDVEYVHSASFPIACNWKVFLENYGDGCYHCSYAHPDLASNIDESIYATELLTRDLSVQHAPPSESSSARFGSERAAVYACWYPNIMLNRYGQWLDLDIVEPVDERTSIVHKTWFYEKDGTSSSSSHDSSEDRTLYISKSLIASKQVHEEDTFLCENVQRGLSARGFDRGRYVPTKQVAGYHFAQRLSMDLRKAVDL